MKKNSFYINGLTTDLELQNNFCSIISLVPSQTELLVDLGLETSVVGITKFCIHPKHLKATKKVVGGTKKVNFQKIKALNPDIIICNKEENTKEMVEELSFICPVLVTDIKTIEDNLQMIIDFGKLFAKENEAQKWLNKISNAYLDFQNFIKHKPIKRVAYFIWKNPYMVAGKDTFINTLLELNHFDNVYKEKGRYPEIYLETILSDGNPELIFLSSEPYPFKNNDVLEMQSFIQNSKITIIKGELFSWYGSRILKSFGYFKTLHL